jgi:hypothetical protein
MVAVLNSRQTGRLQPQDKPSFFPIDFDVLKPLMIDSGCAAIGFAAGVGERQKVGIQKLQTALHAKAKGSPDSRAIAVIRSSRPLTSCTRPLNPHETFVSANFKCSESHRIA